MHGAQDLTTWCRIRDRQTQGWRGSASGPRRLAGSALADRDGFGGPAKPSSSCSSSSASWALSACRWSRNTSWPAAWPPVSIAPSAWRKVRFNPYTAAAQYQKTAYRRSRHVRPLRRHPAYPGQGFVELVVSPCAGGRRSGGRSSRLSYRSHGRAAFQFLRPAREFRSHTCCPRQHRALPPSRSASRYPTFRFTRAKYISTTRC